MPPKGYCECGCGERTSLAPCSNARRGYVKDEPVRFIAGHHARVVCPPRATCTVQDCGLPAKGHELCATHYARWRRTGDPGEAFDPSDPSAHRRRPPVDRLWEKVVRGGVSECWEWTGRLNPSGYGQIVIHPSRGERETWLTHRLAWVVTRGPIPDGLTIDHLCRNTICVNPGHLELVTQRENTLRGTSPSAANARKTHCKRGHEFTPENTYVWQGPRGTQRHCRTCAAEREARRAKRSVGGDRRDEGGEG